MILLNRNELTSEKVLDISPKISSRLAVFPGDQPFRRSVSRSMHEGDPYSLSSMETTLHIGAHADAPSHYHREGRSINEQNLLNYLGPCQVVHIPKFRKGECITPNHLGSRIIQAKRILFRTDSFEEEQWSHDFASLSPDLIAFLHEKEVCLVGIDTPSVDPASSTQLETHAALAKYDLAVLEGLSLQHVSEGLYFLIALPLKIEGAEASPVRAILIAAPTSSRAEQSGVERSPT